MHNGFVQDLIHSIKRILICFSIHILTYQITDNRQHVQFKIYKGTIFINDVNYLIEDV